MILVDSSNYQQIKDDPIEEIAYLSCDQPSSDTSPTPNEIINTVMATNPLAIVLYTLAGNICSLEGDGLAYESVFSILDSGEAEQTLAFLNGTTEEDNVQVSISGNTTQDIPNAEGDDGGNNSAVAMSVLYSITGLVTVLFLVIIATGTIRAHRYPERYGPRGGYEGRPRQSRAKGIARAVLDTLPIIKFGGPPPGKPDPDLEFQTRSRDSSSTPRSPSPVALPVSMPATTIATPPPAAVGNTVSAPKNTTTTRSPASSTTMAQTSTNENEHLGCSICTDDFAVGEDVRVLPCNHKFHPACIDPWLMNVSGTCPLW